MYQTLYVLVYPSRPFAAHWSFWIPHLNAGGQESHTGDRIHVTGDRLNGFEYEYVRDYSVDQDDRKPTAFPIGSVLVSHTGNARNDENRGLDETTKSSALVTSWNQFDYACQQVPAPGPSLNRVTPSDERMRTGPPRRPEVKDCQWWIRKAVSYLSEANMLLPLDAGSQAENLAMRVETLPKH
jgi:hypothetical protein